MTTTTSLDTTTGTPGWLTDLTDLYGAPAVCQPDPVRLGGALHQTWAWVGMGVQITRIGDEYTVRVFNRGVDVELRRGGPLADHDLRRLAELVGLLPCARCRGLREVPTSRDRDLERWTRCGCTPSSHRPAHGWAKLHGREADRHV